MQTNFHSSTFWRNHQRDAILRQNMTKDQIATHDLYTLAANRRAISNFVTILTGKQIPVRFIERGSHTYTDGESITISSKIEKPEDFDVACGLALHEASHILLSDFELLRNLRSEISQKGITSETLSEAQTVVIIKDILNYVEDRRIDYYVFNTAPGYRQYYRSMYDKYFNDRVIQKSLLTNEKTDETFDSYRFRLINIHTENSRLDALKGLQEIWDVLDLRHINRLKNTDDAFLVALQIFKIIDRYVSEAVEKNTIEQESDFGTETNSPDSIPQVNFDEPETDETDESETDDQNTETQESTETEETEESEPEVELTERQKRIIDKKIEKQRDFVNGDANKQMVTKEGMKALDLIDETESELVHVADSTEDRKMFLTKGTDVVFVKNMTESLIDSDQFPLAYFTHYRDKTEKAVEKGIRLGSILAKKLQVRSESRDTIYNRQKAGKIDKRMIAKLGYNDPSVFYKKHVDMYNDMNLHISVDASGSMSGDKWFRTMTNIVSLATACTKIKNLEIQISFRTNTIRTSYSKSKPYVVIAYDSRIDAFSKIRKLFPKLYPDETTPESLCFEAIQKYMVESGSDRDSVFLNISDGAPYYANEYIDYSGEPAIKHINKQIKRFKQKGIKVLSYFVSHKTLEELKEYDNTAMKTFKRSYGQDAKFIDVENVHQISATMNKVFMS